MAGPDLAADLDAVAVGQPDVEDGHIGPGRRDAPVGLLGRAGLADDREVVLGLEQLSQPAAHDLVVVEQEDVNHRLVCADPRRDVCRRLRPRRPTAWPTARRVPEGRLRQLLDAVLDDRLPTSICRPCSQRIVQSATELVDARYGAFGVLDETGTRLASSSPSA